MTIDSHDLPDPDLLPTTGPLQDSAVVDEGVTRNMLAAFASNDDQTSALNVTRSLADTQTNVPFLRMATSSSDGRDAGGDFATAQDVGTFSDGVTLITDGTSASDSDLFQITIESRSLLTFRLHGGNDTTDFFLFDSNQTLVFGSNSDDEPANVATIVEPGTFFLGTFSDAGLETDFAIELGQSSLVSSVTAEDSGSSSQTARQLGAIGGNTLFFTETTAGSDTDVISFSLLSTQSVSIDVHGGTGTTTFALVDAGGNTILGPLSASGIASSPIDLAAGTYFAHVNSSSGKETPYTLEIAADGEPVPVTPQNIGGSADAGGDFSAATALGALQPGSFQIVQDTAANDSDLFSVTLPAATISLGFTSGNDTTGLFFFDANQTLLFEQQQGNPVSRDVLAGDYFIGHFSSGGSAATITTDLSISGVSDATGNSPDTATSLGTLQSGVHFFQDTASSSDSDLFRFTIAETLNAQLALTTDLDPGNARLIRVGDDVVVGTTATGLFSSTAELAPGDYFLDVNGASAAPEEWLVQLNLTDDVAAILPVDVFDTGSVVADARAIGALTEEGMLTAAESTATNDRDLFRFDTVAGQISTSLIGGNASTSVSILDVAGAELTAVDGVYDVTEGTYLADVSTLSGPVTEYALNISHSIQSGGTDTGGTDTGGTDTGGSDTGGTDTGGTDTGGTDTGGTDTGGTDTGGTDTGGTDTGGTDTGGTDTGGTDTGGTDTGGTGTGGGTNFPADTPGDFSNAPALGQLSTASISTQQETTGGDSDLFRFDVVAAGTLTYQYSGGLPETEFFLHESATSQLFASSSTPGATSHTIDLASGTYYAGAFSTAGASGQALYDLILDFTPLADAGGSFADARLLGNLGTNVLTSSDALSGSDTDAYRFSLTDQSLVSLTHNGLTASQATITDSTGRVVVQNAELTSSTNTFGLDAGDYAISFNTPATTTSEFLYDFSLSRSALPDVSGQLASAANLGTLTNNGLQYSDFISSGDTDMFRFSLAAAQDVAINVASGDADTQLQLGTSNGFFFADTMSTGGLIGLNASLPAGQYTIAIASAGGNFDDYALSIANG